MPNHKFEYCRVFESFVDDLDIERGIVSSRVALLLRSAEIKPSFLDISHKKKKENISSFSFFFLKKKMITGSLTIDTIRNPLRKQHLLKRHDQ